MDSNQTVTADFLSTAELAAIRSGLRTAFDRLKQAFQDPVVVGKAECTGQVSYGAKASQAGEYRAAPITVADLLQKGQASDGAPGHKARAAIVVFAGARHRFRHAGTARIVQRLTAKGRQILRRAGRQHHALKLHVLMSFTFNDPTMTDTGGTILVKPPPARRC